jgi:O-antigen ligase
MKGASNSYMVSQLANYYWLIFLFPLLLALGVVLHKKPHYGIYAGVFLLPLEDFTIIFTDFTLIKFIIIVTLLIWLAQIIIRKREPKFLKILRYMIALNVLAGLSYFWSNNVPLFLSSFMTFTQLVIWLIMTVDLLDTESKVKTTAKFFIFGSIIVAVMALILAGSGSLDGEQVASYKGQNPNGFSRTIGLAFIMLIYSISSGYYFENNIINYFGTLIVGLAVILAVSRGTYVALVIPLVLLFIDSKQKHKFKTIFIFLLLFIVFKIFFQGFFEETILLRIVEFQDLGGRVSIWEVATPMIKDHLWFGVGFGNFPDMFGFYSKMMRGWYANSASHSVYIALLAELGIIGLYIFVLFQYKLLRDIIFFSKNSTTRNFLIALFAYLVVGGMSTDLLIDKFYWFGFGLIILLNQVRNRSIQESNTAESIINSESLHL